ncbi:MAG TPA: DUF4785 domain-containing protein [Lysobacter sp.]|jgi:hypothetical protein|nr:DUF4785 domain-containing protein [Lysobacter sp.]
MRIYVNAALIAASFASLSFAHAAQPLVPAGTGDQVPTRLVSLPAPAGLFERAPVSFSWALDPDASLTAPPPYTAESREYWQTVEGTQLQQGVELVTTAPGAVIRISPARGARSLNATDIGVRSNAKAVRLEQAVGAEELRAAGMDVDAGTAVVKLGRENAGGRYALHADKAQGRYIVHVFEPESDVLLTARANRQHVLGGETIAVSVAMSRDAHPLATQAEALLVAPDGSSRPVSVTRDPAGNLNARVRMPVQTSTSAGLWELQVFASADGVSRDARTAFGVAAPTARFKGEAAFDAQAMRVALPVETASPGRYEASGTLYATGSDGLQHPVSQAHSAAWFERGNGMLVLVFDRNHVPVSYGAPYEVRQLELLDQTRMAPLETRERGARF